MQHLRLFFLRHGETSASRSDLFCGARLDPELTTEGASMAEQFADAYRTTEWTAIYSSPQRRAITTAAPLADGVALSPSVQDALKEIDYGLWDGRTKSDVEREFHDDYVRWSADPGWNAPTGGETAIAVARRGRTVIEAIRHRHSTGNVLIVSHKATIRILVCDLLGIDLSRFRDRLSCPVASVTIVEFGSRGPLLVAIGDRSHLAPELRERPGS